MPIVVWLVVALIWRRSSLAALSATASRALTLMGELGKFGADGAGQPLFGAALGEYKTAGWTGRNLKSRLQNRES